MCAMVDDYGYIFIKLVVLKSLLMSAQDRKKLESFRDLESLGSYIKRFFPRFNPEGLSISEFERNLWKTYMDIEEKILVSSPDSIKSFLKTLLVRYEIWNIKIAIHGVIEGLDIDQKIEHIFKKPSVILERENFIKELLKAKNFAEIRSAIKNTPYKKIIERGLEHIEKNGEIFYLEQELDKYYFENMIEQSGYFPAEEQEFIEHFIRSQVDFYNFNLIYRAFFNKISLDEISPFLLNNGYIFNQKKLQILQSSSNFDEFIKHLQNLLKKHKELYIFAQSLKNPNPKMWQHLSTVFLEMFLTRFQHTIMADISLKSISLMFQIILYKQIEIQEIIARAVQIALIQEQY
ncbi:MAG: V-type ATPase subunit [Candidatus Lokiarchaeota archaeon]|nr:V-type ATPase subunit [Candidatus Harpocratesius repetitus]